MPSFNIKIINIDQIRSAFRVAPELMGRELNKAIQKTLFSIQAETILNVHPARGINIITGGLLSATERPPIFSALKGIYNIDINYAGFVHNGTRFMRARPFLQNAIDSKQEAVNQFFLEAVNTVLLEIGNAT